MTTRDADGNTPLHLAVMGSRADVVSLLIEHKADIEAVNLLGQTPFYISKLAATLPLNSTEQDEAAEVAQVRGLRYVLKMYHTS